MDVEPESPSAGELGFSVPILEIDMLGFAQHRDAILSYLLSERQREVTSVQRSNQGGWHSESDLNKREDEAISWVTARISALAELLLRSEGELDATSTLRMRNCWAVMNESGHWNAPHSHYGDDWSGALYVSVPSDMSTPDNPTAGRIIFVDPLGRPHGHPATAFIAPVEGRLSLFPSHLVHVVAPHSSERTRVSLAFNFRVVDQVTRQPA